MILDRTDQNPGAQFLFSLACLVVIVYGLKFAAPILLPAALALFLAVLSLPMMIWLRKHRVPKATAIIIPVIVNVAVVVAIGVHEEGHREILGLVVVTSDDGADWLATGRVRSPPRADCESPRRARLLDISETWELESFSIPRVWTRP